MANSIVRCPYCVLGDDFRPMLPKQEGWFICVKCGHTATLEKPDYKCRCEKCEELNRAAWWERFASPSLEASLIFSPGRMTASPTTSSSVFQIANFSTETFVMPALKILPHTNSRGF
jgi:hypothetical protein